MKKISLISGGALLIIILGVWSIFRMGNSQDVILSSSSGNPALPVIQIIKPTVQVLDDNGMPLRQLANGDVLTPPIHLKLGPNADAVIVYVDGSSARLSANTDIKIEQGSYDTKTGSLSSKIFLYFGHVWSKVVALATPESSWQVQTPHAVATVRGTAFDSKVEKGKSTFTGSEHQVAIIPIDPDTGKEMNDKDASLDEDKQIVLGDADMHAIKNNKEKIESKDFDEKKSDDKGWIDQNTHRDGVVDDIKTEQGDQKFIRDMMFQETDRMTDTGSDTKSDTNTNKDSQTGDTRTGQTDDSSTHQTTTGDTRGTATGGNVGGGAGVGTDAIEKVTIRMNIPKPVIEGMRLPYTIIAITKNGAEKDVTAQASVKAVGGIGSIPTPGFFVAKIDADKTELGTIPGAVSGVWIDPNTKTSFEFSTSVFNVSIYIEPVTDTRG